MRLEKWYADWVNPDGHAIIFYLAYLHWGPLQLGYAGHINGANGRQTIRWLPGYAALPAWQGTRLLWPDVLDKNGGEPLIWEAAPSAADTPTASAAFNLYQTPDNKHGLHWQPVMPNAQIKTVRSPHAHRGYVERLCMDFAPWHLGLRRLLWGRFCGQLHSVIWIVWEGAHPQSRAWFNGNACAPLTVTHLGAANAELALQWQAPHTVLKEKLMHGSLERLAWLPCAPLLRFIQAEQTKYCAAAQLHVNNHLADSGHVIFEEVRWP